MNSSNGFKYIRYSRKSSEAKEKQALSIKDQNAECDDLINREDLQVVRRIEESKTSFKPNVREGFNLMVDLIKSGKANAILTWKPDRLCRNPEEGGKLLQMLQDGILKEIRTATGDIYSQDSDHLILQIHFGMANQYSRNLSQNVKRSLGRKVNDRKQYPRPAPIGYQGCGERGQRNIELHSLEAPLVTQAFELASTGLYSLAVILLKLYEKGLRTKKGKKISKSHLHKILTNPVYYGFFNWKGELYEGDYQPLISKGLFDLVQEKLKDRSKPSFNTWERDFAKVFRCGDCGCMITTSIKGKFVKKLNGKKLYTYHHCTHKRGICKQKPVADEHFKLMIYEKIEQISIDEEAWNLGMELIKAKHTDEMNKNKYQLAELHKEQQRIRDQITRLVDMRTGSELSKEEFIEQKQRLTERLASVDNRASDNSYSVKTWLEQMEEFLNTTFQARYIIEHAKVSEKQRMLKRIGKNFILKGGKIDITLQEPYDVLLKTSYRTNVLPS